MQLKVRHLFIKLNLDKQLTCCLKFQILVLIIKNTNNKITGAFTKNRKKHPVSFVQYFQRATQPSSGKIRKYDFIHTKSMLGKYFHCNLTDVETLKTEKQRPHKIAHYLQLLTVE